MKNTKDGEGTSSTKLTAGEEKVFLGEYEEKKELLIIGDGWGI